MMMKTAAILLALAANVSANGGGSLRKAKKNDLTEDIEFWTRMTQAMGSMPATRKPTNTPTRQPIRQPTGQPTGQPTRQTTVEPTASPVAENLPTVTPTAAPSFPCNLTPEERAQRFREIALTVTNAATLDDASSSQAKALDWIINEDFAQSPCPVEGNCESVQRYTMAAFYFAADGGAWDQCNAASDLNDAASVAAADAACDRTVTPFPVNNPRIGDTSTASWLSPVDECEWGGLACWGTDDQRNGCMDQIDFESDGLAGTLISEMRNLDQLRFFILEQGNTTGAIPTEYGLFERLLIFDMDFNDLTGDIPEEIYDISTLQQLDLNDNFLEGTISTRIGQLETLTFLQVDHNSLTGTIPTELGLLDALRIGFFNDNDLTGSMPLEVCANRNNTNPPGFLGTLVVDCNPPENPEVECTCCSSCNVVGA